MPQAIHEPKVQFMTALPSIHDVTHQFIKKQGGLRNQIVLYFFVLVWYNETKNNKERSYGKNSWFLEWNEKVS